MFNFFNLFRNRTELSESLSSYQKDCALLTKQVIDNFLKKNEQAVFDGLSSSARKPAVSEVNEILVRIPIAGDEIRLDGKLAEAMIKLFKKKYGVKISYKYGLSYTSYDGKFHMTFNHKP